MRIASNRIADVKRYFYDELSALYPKEEIDVFTDLCFESYLGYRRTDVALKMSETISESQLLKFSFAVKELKAGKPVQYILGRADFYRSEFFVNEHVLIPRPETEELVDLIIRDVKALSPATAFKLLDIGTGSGCIAISLKKHLPAAEVWALDLSEEALKVAERNAAQNKVNVNFLRGDILSSQASQTLPSGLNIIVSNPPYVCISEKESMEKNVLEHEPHLALFVEDEDPLLFYKAIADLARKNLAAGGKIYFEINPLMAEQMLNMMRGKGFKNLSLVKDLNDKNRILRCTI